MLAYNMRRAIKGKMNPEKKFLIDYAFGHQPIRSFIDLGGVWGVDGSYTFYCLDKYKVDSAILVDLEFTERLLRNQKKRANLKLIKGNFGEKTVMNQLSNVDAIFMFDILLHQVKPNWDEILEIYAPLADCFLIFDPQYKAAQTVRLMDLCEKEYFANVPHDKTVPVYNLLFEKQNEFVPERNKIRRDIPDIWQWGITNKDLITKMETLGFSLEYLKNCGRFGNLTNFDNYSFMFKKIKKK